MDYKDSEFYGYSNGKLLWFAHSGLLEEISGKHCEGCNPPDDTCEGCGASKAHLEIEKQIINEGVKFMTALARAWRKIP